MTFHLLTRKTYFILAGLFYALNALAYIGFLEIIGIPATELVPTGHPLVALFSLMLYGVFVTVGTLGIFRYSVRSLSFYLWGMVAYSVLFSVVIFIHCFDYVQDMIHHKYLHSIAFAISVFMNAYGVGTSIASVYGLGVFRVEVKRLSNEIAPPTTSVPEPSPKGRKRIQSLVSVSAK